LSNFECIQFALYGMAVVDMRSRYDTSALLATGDVTSMMTTTATQAMVKVMLTTPTAIRMRQYLSSSVRLSHHDDDRLSWPRPRRRTEEGWRLRVDLDLELPDRVDLDYAAASFRPGPIAICGLLLLCVLIIVAAASWLMWRDEYD
jgi:hypothetical protein